MDSILFAKKSRETLSYLRLLNGTNTDDVQHAAELSNSLKRSIRIRIFNSPQQKFHKLPQLFGYHAIGYLEYYAYAKQY